VPGRAIASHKARPSPCAGARIFLDTSEGLEIKRPAGRRVLPGACLSWWKRNPSDRRRETDAHRRGTEPGCKVRGHPDPEELRLLIKPHRPAHTTLLLRAKATYARHITTLILRLAAG
jgi:hypothetical protein